MLTSHSFLDARTEDGKPLDEEYVKAEMLIIMLAGADTTGTAIQSLIHNILADETVYSKIMTEIDAATRAGQLSSMPQYHEVQKSCPYYSACVRETLRLYPSGPTVFPRLVSKGGMVFDGKFAPEGTEVAANPWHANRDENVYGKDATVFRPERWLESEEKIAKYKKYDLTFGYGARGCLGRDLALMELYKTPVQVGFAPS
jgi:cytochrome P450